MLRPGTKGSPHARLLCYGEPWWWSVTGGLLETVMTGEPGFERVHGSSVFERLAAHPDASAIFDAHMTAMTSAEVDAVVAAAPLTDTGTIVDVAGGRGTLLAAVLRARPGLRGVLFDLPDLAESAVVGERCEAVSGSFFEAAPLPAVDASTLKDIVHDWDDERAIAILRIVLEPRSRPRAGCS